jgi:hypothetical protein
VSAEVNDKTGMDEIVVLINQLDKLGFAVSQSIFDAREIKTISAIIEHAGAQNSNFRKDKDLFAIRNLLGEIPELKEALFTPSFFEFKKQLLGDAYFIVKAIYFDKPGMSNWLVSWHQDTKISVNRKTDLPGFRQWSLKQGLYAVEPPAAFLQDTFTFRIHLDDTDETNGALKVVPGSHLHGVMPDDDLQKYPKEEVICNVPSGAIMLMKPLTLHASSKSTSDRNRRVIHLEFCSMELPNGLRWRERPGESITSAPEPAAD